MIFCVRLTSGPAIPDKGYLEVHKAVARECGVELLPEGNRITMWVKGTAESQETLQEHSLVEDVIVSSLND